MSLIPLCETALARFKRDATIGREAKHRIELRRTRMGEVPPLAGIAFAVELGGEVAGPANKTTQLFTALHLVALLADLDTPVAYLGQALAEAGLSELRLERLLRARPERVAEQLRAVGRHLLAKGTPVRVMDLIWLLVSQDQQSRLRIAQSFYRATSSKE